MSSHRLQRVGRAEKGGAAEEIAGNVGEAVRRNRIRLLLWRQLAEHPNRNDLADPSAALECE